MCLGKLLIKDEQLSSLFVSLSALRSILACRAGTLESPFIQLGLTLALGTIDSINVHDRKLIASHDIAYDMEGLFFERFVVCKGDIWNAGVVDARAEEENTAEGVGCVDGEHFAV